jgi:hypothetical protein
MQFHARHGCAGLDAWEIFLVAGPRSVGIDIGRSRPIDQARRAILNTSAEGGNGSLAFVEPYAF